jgi:hypothetical protein
VCRRAKTFAFEINSVFIKLFQYQQQPRARISPRWLNVGNPQHFYASDASVTFEVLVAILTILAAGGLGLALWLRDPFLAAPAVVYLCFGVAHSLTFMDLMYYYVKLPLLSVFAAYLVDRTWPRRLSIFSASVPVGAILAAPVVALSLALTLWVLA